MPSPRPYVNGPRTNGLHAGRAAGKLPADSVFACEAGPVDDIVSAFPSRCGNGASF
jgi:hypothetical protein